MPAVEVCTECDGTGWKIVEREEVSGAVRCGCVAADRAERLESGSGLPPLYANASFENFLLSRDNPIGYRELTEVYLAVRAYARDFPNPKKPGLLLMGEPGTGKTHLAVAAFRAVMAKGFEGLFFDYQNLLDRIRSGYDASSNSSDRETYRVAMDTEVILLDDLGAHRVTDWVEDTVTSIITSRCNQKKALIATTNLIDPEAGDARYERGPGGKVDYRTTLTDRIGPRARSRLFEMCRVIKMPLVEDFRMRRPGETR
jgi:DNA replication protein DnaC